MTSPEPAASGILVIDKPEGWTSHQVVGRIRRLAGTRKVGHAGTLDPMATGVLVVGVNRATRLLGQLMLTDKGYTATVRLGVSTITDDAEGEVTSRRAVVDLDHDQLESALEPLRGDILQVPSRGVRDQDQRRSVVREGPGRRDGRPRRPPGPGELGWT